MKTTGRVSLPPKPKRDDGSDAGCYWDQKKQCWINVDEDFSFSAAPFGKSGYGPHDAGWSED